MIMIDNIPPASEETLASGGLVDIWEYLPRSGQEGTYFLSVLTGRRVGHLADEGCLKLVKKKVTSAEAYRSYLLKVTPHARALSCLFKSTNSRGLVNTDVLHMRLTSALKLLILWREGKPDPLPEAHSPEGDILVGRLYGAWSKRGRFDEDGLKTAFRLACNEIAKHQGR